MHSIHRVYHRTHHHPKTFMMIALITIIVVIVVVEVIVISISNLCLSFAFNLYFQSSMQIIMPKTRQPNRMYVGYSLFANSIRMKILRRVGRNSIRHLCRRTNTFVQLKFNPCAYNEYDCFFLSAVISIEIIKTYSIRERNMHVNMKSNS